MSKFQMDFHGQIGTMLQIPFNNYYKTILKQANVFMLIFN